MTRSDRGQAAVVDAIKALARHVAAVIVAVLAYTGILFLLTELVGVG